jgi:hypothetical protein
MLSALILICSTPATTDVNDCTRHNATVVMRLPAEFGNPVTCFMHGQAYLAETSIGQAIADGDVVRILCRPNVTINAAADGAD